MSEHHFDFYEHAPGALVAATCRCGWRSEFGRSEDQASAMLEDHLEVVGFAEGDVDRS